MRSATRAAIVVGCFLSGGGVALIACEPRVTSLGAWVREKRDAGMRARLPAGQYIEGAWHKWRISAGEIWFWDAFHEDADYGHALELTLANGAHELVIANCMDQVALDRSYITAQGDTPPGNDTPCDPPHSIQLGDTCAPSCGSHGITTCGLPACEGKSRWLRTIATCAVSSSRDRAREIVNGSAAGPHPAYDSDRCAARHEVTRVN